MTGELWAGLTGWLDRGLAAFVANGPFLTVQLLLVVLGVPLWLHLLDRMRWSGVRRRLSGEALALHLSATGAAATVAKQLFAQDAPPLGRLQAVRRALSVQRAEVARFGRAAAMLAGAMAPRLADMATGADAFAARAEALLAELVRLYLKEAELRLGSNVVHGDDHLGFSRGQIVALDYRTELEALAAEFASMAEANRARIARALGWRARRGAAARLEASAIDAAALVEAVKRFAATLQPMDPESTSYRNRKQGERTARSLDGLIARFDRGGVIA